MGIIEAGIALREAEDARNNHLHYQRTQRNEDNERINNALLNMFEYIPNTMKLDVWQAGEHYALKKKALQAQLKTIEAMRAVTIQHYVESIEGADEHPEIARYVVDTIFKMAVDVAMKAARLEAQHGSSTE